MGRGSAFGFDPTTVFGDVRAGTKNKKKSRKGKDCLECMQEDSMTDGFGLGIDTFSLANPEIDVLGIGENFGEVIGKKAGMSNGADGGFLNVIGNQQVSVPSVTGRGSVGGIGSIGRPRGKGRARKPKAVKGQPKQSPLQRASGTKFGSVDDRFSENIIGNVKGARRRISEFRARRKGSKVESRDPKQLEFNPRTEARDRPRAEEPKALPAPPESSRGSLPRETGSQAIARLRKEDESKGAT